MEKGIQKTNKFLVVDLDQTFIHSRFDKDSDIKLSQFKLYSDPKNKELREKIYSFSLLDGSGGQEGIGKNMVVWGVYRPNTEEFLKFAAQYFEAIYVWSAGQHKYVHCITELLFADIEGQPIKILTIDHCVYEGKSDYHKPLSVVTKINPKATVENTYLLDDKEDNCRSAPNNLILIPAYETEEKTRIENFKHWVNTDDHCLKQFMYWLMKPKTMNSSDIRKLDKSEIFTTSLSKYRKKLGLDINNKEDSPFSP